MCIDTTGFVRPQLLFLLKYLYNSSISKVDFLYSEPAHYTKKEETVFALGGIKEVRQVHGYEGVHALDVSNNLLVIGAGYDSMLIRSVAESKGNARKMQILGLPSLRADMYQENVLRANKAEESLGNCETIFAPANDPFITADVLKEAVLRSHSLKPITNLYLCPLATKAQVLGFGLFYLKLQAAAQTGLRWADHVTNPHEHGLEDVLADKELFQLFLGPDNDVSDEAWEIGRLSSRKARMLLLVEMGVLVKTS